MDVKKVCNFSFASNTTYGCGGVAKVAYFPKDINQATYIFSKLLKDREKFFTLGNGSDVLAQDGFYNGNIIVTKGLKEIKMLPDGSVYCESGVTVSSLLNFCIERGLGGLEYLCGIPATVGGLCYMNAGIAQKYIADNIVSVTVFDGKIRVFDNKMCNFAYKHSTMRDIKCLILSCLFKVEPSCTQKVKDKCKYYMQKRAVLPKGKSCGCVFKNPEGKSAGKLIEEAGLKGYSIGSAFVSKSHANFIINSGTRSQDVYNLIKYVKETVYKKYATELEEEVCYIGDFK